MVRMLTLINLETRTISSARCFPRFSDHVQGVYRSNPVDPCRGWFGILPDLTAVLWTDRHTTLTILSFLCRNSMNLVLKKNLHGKNHKFVNF